MRTSDGLRRPDPFQEEVDKSVLEAVVRGPWLRCWLTIDQKIARAVTVVSWGRSSPAAIRPSRYLPISAAPSPMTRQAADLEDGRYPYSWLPADDSVGEARELSERGPEAFPD